MFVRPLECPRGQQICAMASLEVPCAAGPLVGRPQESLSGDIAGGQSGWAPGWVYRRSNDLSATAGRDLSARDSRLMALLGTLRKMDLPDGVSATSLRGQLPFSFASLFKIPGVTVGETTSFAGHLDDALRGISLRQEIMAQLARTPWVLEVSIFRSMRGAPSTSLVCYGLAASGSAAYEGLLDRLETQCTHVAARRITGVARTDCLEALRAVVGGATVRKLYLQQCGIMIGCTLRAHRVAARDD